MTNGDIITYQVTMPTLIRVCNIDKKEFVTMLKAHLKSSAKNKQTIAENLDVPLTQVEHYFRTDRYHSFPDADVWFKLKQELGITTDKYDKELTTYIDGDNRFDMQNRIYDADGLCPTITGTQIYIVARKGYK